MKKTFLSWLIMILFGISSFLPNQVQALAIPTFDILGVTENEIVTIETQNFPANKTFEVRMGSFGTKGIDGILVETVDSAGGGQLVFTFEIPASMQGESMIAIRLESTSSTHYAYNWFYNQTYGTHEGGSTSTTVPSVSIVSVKAGENITVKLYNFPSNETIQVLMDVFGDQAENGLEVESFDSAEGGTFTKTIAIPESLQNEYKIAVRLTSEDSNLSVYTWFINETGASGGTGTVTNIPTISIIAVEAGDSVTIKTQNFPANKTFNILMGLIGSKGINGVSAGTLDSGGGGSLTETISIPDSLQNEYQIAIRLESSSSGHYAYNWFYNNTIGDTPSDDPGSPGYTGIPTFTITEVRQGESVTIQTNNFPESTTFAVLMGKIGTMGISGIEIGTIDSGDGGTFSETFEIPASLANDHQIAIRLESTSSAHYAFNWFYNQTTP